MKKRTSPSKWNAENLVVRGERKEEKEEKRGFYKTERTYGSFFQDGAAAGRCDAHREGVHG